MRARLAIVSLFFFFLFASSGFAQYTTYTYTPDGKSSVQQDGKDIAKDKDGVKKKDGKGVAVVRRHNAFLSIGSNPQNPFRELQPDEMLVKPIRDLYIVTKGGPKADATSVGLVHKGIVIIVKKGEYASNSIREFVIADCGNDSYVIRRGDKKRTLQPLDTKDLFVFSYNGAQTGTELSEQITDEGFPEGPEGKGMYDPKVMKAIEDFLAQEKEKNKEERDKFIADLTGKMSAGEKGKEKEGGASWVPWVIGGVVVATLATISIIALSKANKAERNAGGGGGGTGGGPAPDPINKMGYQQQMAPPRQIGIGFGFSL
jgi:hypothetical protein